MLFILELGRLKINQVVEPFCIWLLKIGVVISKRRIQKEIFPSFGVSKGPILSTKMTKTGKYDYDFNQTYQSKDFFTQYGLLKHLYLSVPSTSQVPRPNLRCRLGRTYVYRRLGRGTWLPFNLLHLFRIFAIDEMKLLSTFFNKDMYCSSFPSFTEAM